MVKDVSYVYESFARGGTAVYVNGHSSDDPTDYASQAYDDSESHFNPAGKGAISLHEVGEVAPTVPGPAPYPERGFYHH